MNLSNTLLILALILSFGRAYAQNVVIPDTNFKNYLVGNTAINTNGDTEIQVSEATNFTGIINCANLSIADLTGIEAFSNIDQLSCGLNNLTSLDVSQNSALVDLFCSSNNLMNLTLPSNLLSVDCSDNPLTSLDFSQNTLMAIEVRSCNLNYLNIRNNGTNGNLLNANFDATNNPNLTCIEVSDVAYATANLTNIDATASFSLGCGPIVNIPDANFKAYLVGNTLINTNGDGEIQVSETIAFGGAINCSNLNITDLTGIEAFVYIDELNCSNNSIVDLDLRQHARLSIVDVQSCNLSTLDIRNGQNVAIYSFNSTNNPNLTCVLVDDPATSAAYWIADATTTFNINCNPNVVTIPDANLKTYLVGNTAINTNGDAEIQFTEAAAFTGTINCSNSSVEDLTGVEAFVNLTGINFSNNPHLFYANLNQNVNLVTLSAAHCYNLGGIGIGQCVNLVTIDCNGSDLNGINVTQCPNLVTLNCGGNGSIASLDLTQNTNLVNLSCEQTDITSLDLTQNVNLETLLCSFNGITSLDIRNGNNTNMTSFDATFNAGLTCIDVDNVAYSTANWTSIDGASSFSSNCSGPPPAPIVNIPDANFKAYLLGNSIINANSDNEIQITEAANFTGTIDCYGLNISDLTGIEAFPYMLELVCGNNNLTSLDLSQNGDLVDLMCAQNNLVSLVLPSTGNLVVMNCGFNPLTSLNLAQTSLLDLDAQSCNLNSLDMRGLGNANLNVLNNPNLTCITVDNVATATANWTNIDPGTSFSTNCTLPAPIVTIVDANFKAYLVGNTVINTNGDADIQVTEATAFGGTIDCSNLSIIDLTGIEAFTNLSGLNCANNNLTDLDFTQNANLLSLDVQSCGLNSLNMRSGNNSILSAFNSTNNPNLTCIEVDDVVYSTTNWTNIDSGTSFNTNCTPAVVYIPDANFKNYLVTNGAINTNGDAEIQVTEAIAFTGTISCSSLSIVELTGIEAFVNLTGLVCRNNHQLLGINLSQNTGLVTVDCSQNYQLGFVSVQGPTLRTLNCSGGEFYGLNVSQATGLVELNCSNNPSIDNLNLSQNTNLERLYCTNTDMSNLDLSQNTNLEIIDCQFNSIVDLDLHLNTNLTTVNCSNNSLSSMDVKNGNNTLITSFDASGNFGLSCINVNDVAYATANWTVGTGTSFSTNCSGPAPIVNIPDANFKAYLVGNASINTNGDTEIQMTEATPFTGTINCQNLNIVDLTGVEAFVNLTQLRCNNNNISTIDVSQNLSLIQLLCYNNNIGNLDVRQNANLAILHCVGNPISSLDLRQNANLTRLFCSSTSISTLDLSQNISLQRLYCGSTPLTSLDLRLNTELVVFDCASTQLSSLDLRNGRNTDITTFKAGNNSNLSCIQVDDPAYSTANWTNVDPATSFSTSCSAAAPVVMIPDANFKAYLVGNTTINTNGDTEIQVSEATAFGGKIDCPNLNIADLTGVEAFVNLTQLVCNNNNLTNLNVTQNTSLTWIHCVNNSISSLDVTQNTNLSLLYCSNNQLTSLDLTQNTNLKKLYAANNQFSSLNVKNGNNTSITVFQVTGNSNLTCIEVDNVAYSTTNWTNIDATASFNTNCSGVAPIVTIPDAAFKAYLIGNTAINTNGDTEIQVTEAIAFNGTINCSNLSITFLTGIEAFVNLTELNCSSNAISDLNLTQNANLEVLDCSSNSMNTLNVKNGNNTVITYFEASSNNLSCIDVDDIAYSTANWTNIDAGVTFSLNCSTPISIVYIPDANFKTYLVSHPSINTNGDAEIQVSEAIAFGGKIDCPNLNIAYLTGVEAFVNLTQLVCNNNNLTNLNVTQNTSLTWIHCVNNSISSLDVTQNTNLSLLYCSNNQLTSLDLTQNTNLKKLYAANNQFSSLNVKNGNNTSITVFQVTGNPSLTCIEVDDVVYSTTNWTSIDATASFNTNCSGVAPIVTIPDVSFKAYLLVDVAINTNGDTEIQVTEALAFAGTIDCSNLNIADLTGIEVFENVTTLDCSSNQLSNLDLSQNTSLTNLNCSSNQLSDLDLRNGNNVNITYFDARNNSSLTCIEVDNAAYSTANWTNVDAGTMFNTVCGAPIVTIPDANFKAYLVGHSSINTNGDAEIQVSEAVAFGGRISCQNLNIADLTGVETFVNLTQLVCYNNNLTSLDVTQNTSLTWIHCVNNSIGSLDITQNVNLSLLYCSKNQLTTLDLTQNVNLQKLYAATNQFSSLNIKNGNNTDITVFQVTDNPNLTCIEVDDVAYSTTNWTDIDATASFSINCAVPMANGSNNNTNNANGAGSEISTSISTINKEMNLSAYPNPTAKDITLNFGKMYKEARIQVINLTGQIVLSQQLNNVSNTILELENAKGIYFINIQTEEGTATLKVIKK